MPIRDTTPEAQAVQDAIHRAMTGEQRVILAFEMSMFARELARAGIQEQHPDWPEDRVDPRTPSAGFPAKAAAPRILMTVSDVLQRITTALDQNDVAYMLTGSFASAYYGTPRSTQDIDVIVEATPAQLSAFVNSLPVDQYYVDLDAALQALKAESMFNVVDRSTGWKIDFIIRKSRPFSREEFRRRVRAHLQGVSAFCRQHGGYCDCQARMVEAGAIAKADR